MPLEEPPRLEYRSVRDDQAGARQETRRHFRNAFFALASLACIFIGTVVGLITVCSVLVAYKQADANPIEWRVAAIGSGVAVAMLWFGHRAAGRVDPD